jgi:hypothetical protein
MRNPEPFYFACTDFSNRIFNFDFVLSDEKIIDVHLKYQYIENNV